MKFSILSIRMYLRSNWLYLTLRGMVFIFIEKLKLRRKLKSQLISLAQRKKVIEKILGETVVSGPFKNMVYPALISHGSVIYPKILGTYESELHEVIRSLPIADYDVIIDIGCAEGYYAVGFGLLNSKASIFAYDIDYGARQRCRMMADENGIGERMLIGQYFNSNDLKTINPSLRTLIICDCEGYERHLFNDDNIGFLQNSDLIIETHDCFDIGVSLYLKNLFKHSHKLRSVFSVDDIQKALTYQIEAISSLDLLTKLEALRENRSTIMEWVVFEKL